MRKYFVYLLALLIFSLLIGCSQFSDLKVPSKVTVKANPEYHLSVGSIDMSLWEEGYIESQVESAMGYKPEGSTNEEVNLLLKYPIMEIPIDVSSYLENVGFSDKVSGVSFSQKIDIPDMKVSQKMNISLDSVNDRIVDLVKFGEKTTNCTLSIDFETEECFDAITFSSGTMVITSLARDFGPLEVVTLSYDGKVIAKGNMVDKVCKLDLAGASIYKNGMSIDFSPSKDAENYFTAYVEKGSQVSSVTGLTLKDVEVPFNQTINTKENFKSFDSCTVKEGQINLALTIDNSWSGATVKYPVTLSGGISGTSATVEKDGKQIEVIDLADKSLLPEDTVATSNVKISFNKGKINFTKPPVLSFDTDIKSIKEVTLTMADFNPTSEQSIALGEDVFKLVNSFDLGKSEIHSVYVNDLPEGNDIGITFISNFLGFDNKEVMKSTAETEEGQTKLDLIAKYDHHLVKISREPVEADEFKEIDMKFNVTLPGSTTENPNRVTLKDVEIGKSYQISFKVDQSAKDNGIEYKWNEANLNLEDMSMNESLDTGFSKKSFSDILGDLITAEDGSTPEVMLAELPVYLYCVKPSGEFEELKISGVVKFAADEGDVYVIGDEKGSATLKFTDKLPDLKYDPETGVVITDVAECEDPENPPYEKIDTLSDAFDKLGDKNLVLDYAMNCSFGKDAGGFTVYPPEEKTDENGEVISKTSNISIMMYIVIPLKFGFKNDVCIDLTNLLQLNSDLLGRTEASTEEGMAEFMKYFEYAKINYKIKQLPISCPGWKFTFNAFGNDPEHEKDACVSNFAVGGKGEIKIPNMEELLQVYPLIPTVRIDIPGNPKENDSWISLKSSGLATLNLDFEVKVNAELTVIGGNQ